MSARNEREAHSLVSRESEPWAKPSKRAPKPSRSVGARLLIIAAGLTFLSAVWVLLL